MTGQIKPTATLCGKPHESEDAHQSRIRYGEGKAQKRHTLKHRNTRPCLACFRSEIIIIIIMIIVGYDNNTPFFSPCIRQAEHFNCVWKTQTGSKRQCYLYTNWLEKITSSPEWICSLTFSSVFRQEWLERTPGLEIFWKKYKESVQDMLDAMEAEAKVRGVFFSLSLEMTRRRICTFRYLIF